MKAGSLRINCPESTNRVVLDITANDEPPIRIVKHGEKGARGRGDQWRRTRDTISRQGSTRRHTRDDDVRN